MPGIDTQTIDLRVDARVAWITLNRPDALNAWTPQLGRELIATLDRVAGDSDVRAVVLTGAGRAFSSGADLKAVSAGDGSGDAPPPDVLATLRDIYNPLLIRVRELPKPVLAAVNGGAVGIGCSLALAADLVVAAESAYFLLAFANIGLALDGGASASLVARIGHARASEMALLAERIPAAQAKEWGLINRVVPDGELPTVVGEIAGRLAAGPPGSYATIKRTLNTAALAGFAATLDQEAVFQKERLTSGDFIEGVSAFLEKRPANFTGN
jgi:2-(1,2-epoxy-1,2-dihydrophenyl)acetyl-CoA isomerase